jgi:hypothetical protein
MHQHGCQQQRKEDLGRNVVTVITRENRSNMDASNSKEAYNSMDAQNSRDTRNSVVATAAVMMLESAGSLTTHVFPQRFTKNRKMVYSTVVYKNPPHTPTFPASFNFNPS